MKFNDIKESVLKQFHTPNGHKVVPFILGTPGGGKSACVREIAKELATEYSIPEERIIEFNPSLRDPVDVLGIPQKSADGTHSEWLPPSEFWAIRKGQGPSILILEELSDASMAMQNPLCRVLLDRHAGQLPLSEKLFIMATGNRVEDKSGANRLSTKLGNRTRQLQFETDIEDWIKWALTYGISPMLCAFLKFRPQLLSEFDPKRTVNPTPRSWEDVSMVPEDLPPLQFLEHITGAVGEGAAAEYTAFLKLANEMPSLEDIRANPSKFEIPTNPSVLYALTGMLGSQLKGDNIKPLAKYIKRMSPEFQAITWKTGFLLNKKELISTKEFTDWAVENGSILQGV